MFGRLVGVDVVGEMVGEDVGSAMVGDTVGECVGGPQWSATPTETTSGP